jgi:hypothetical protein
LVADRTCVRVYSVKVAQHSKQSAFHQPSLQRIRAKTNKSSSDGDGNKHRVAQSSLAAVCYRLPGGSGPAKHPFQQRHYLIAGANARHPGPELSAWPRPEGLIGSTCSSLWETRVPSLPWVFQNTGFPGFACLLACCCYISLSQAPTCVPSIAAKLHPPFVIWVSFVICSKHEGFRKVGVRCDGACWRGHSGELRRHTRH